MNRIYSFLISFLLLIMTFIFVLSGDFCVYANYNDNYYSNPSSVNSCEISTLDFFTQNFNEYFSESEKTVLSEKGIFIKYENKIPTNCVETSINGDALIVTAYEYTYMDINNRCVIWYPKEVILNGITKQFEKKEDYYSCSFNNLVSSDEYISVYYSLKLIINKDNINNTLNETYEMAKNLEIKREEYNSNKALYEQYIIDLKQYQNDMESYNSYLLAKSEWDKKNNLYLKYLSDYNLYLETEKKYEEYTNLWNQYLIDKEKYNAYKLELQKYEETAEEKIEDYQTYVEKMKNINYRISILSLITKEMTSLNRSVYSAVIGSTVDLVLENEASLIELGVDKKVVEIARNATNKLRELFNAYVSLDNDKEIYSFYVKNYSDLKKYSEALLTSLEYLYRKGPVEKLLSIIQNTDNNYKEKYIILIAQLGLLCNALDDNDVKNYEKKDIIDLTSWKIDNRTIKDILNEEISIVDDSIQSYPPGSERSYPEPVEKPTPPAEVKEPVAPTEVVPISEPEEVENPGEPPLEVKKPSEPEKVIEPEEFKLEGFDLQLVTEYHNGQLKKHKVIDNDYEYLIDTVLNKKIRTEGKVTITFYDETKLNILAVEQTDIGEHIIYSGVTPTKIPDDVIYQSYEFVGWVDDNGNFIDLNNVTKDLFAFPKFRGIYKKYQITWNLPDGLIVQEYEYGSMPEAPVGITKEDDEYYYYSFKGWNTNVEKVTEDKEYTAIFNAFPYYTVVWNVGEEQYKQKYKEGEIPSLSEELLIKANTSTQYFCFYQWDKAIQPVNENQEYTAIFTEHSFVKSDGQELDVNFNENNVIINTETRDIDISGLLDYKDIDEYKLIININQISVSVDIKDINSTDNENITNIELLENVENGKTKYKLRFIKDKNEVVLGCNIYVSVLGEYDESHTRVFEDETMIKSTVHNECISFIMKENHEYRISSIYSINILPSTIEIKSDVEEAEVGQIVSLELNGLPLGMKLDKLYVQDTNDEYISVDGNAFIMPASNVFVGAIISKIEYTVSFIIDGEIISSNKYYYGDIVEVPKNTFKISDDQYSYEFIGWDKEITPVCEDITYVANYEEKPIVDNAYRRINILRIIKIVLISIVSSTVVLIGLFIYLKKRSKKQI